MWKRILAEAAIVLLQTVLLLGLTATLGVERGEQPAASSEPSAVDIGEKEGAFPGVPWYVRLCPFLLVAAEDQCGHPKEGSQDEETDDSTSYASPVDQ